MAGLIDIAESLCMAVARGDSAEALRLTRQAAAKMGAPRGARIEKALEAKQRLRPVNLAPSKYWHPVTESRSPWSPSAVLSYVDEWILEAKHGEMLALNGERVMPLLLSGETRCGKTSTLCRVAMSLGIPVVRLSLASVVDSYMGASSRELRSAFAELHQGSGAGCLWLIDEIDGIGCKRRNGSGSDQERSLAVNSLLTEVEALPPGAIVAATSNRNQHMDPAVVSRFSVVHFPAWNDLSTTERLAFSASHGHETAVPAASYAEAVKQARRSRVAALIAAQERAQA